MEARAEIASPAPSKSSGLEHIKAVRRFEEAEEVTREARELAERDRDYRDGKQWTPAEEQALKKRKQPVVTYNRVLRKVNYLLGLERQSRKDPRAFPRNPNDEQAAQAATDAIRYACENSLWDEKRSEAADNLVVEGIGIIEVGVKKARGGIDPVIRHIPWDRFYFDPHSSSWDFSDASFKGLVVWMDLEDAKQRYPEKADVLSETWMSGKDAQTYDDKPKHNLWSDYARKRVRICQEYRRTKDGWEYCVFTSGGYLVEPGPSQYVDEEGVPECPLVAVSLYIDRDNNRYGEVRMMISPQDEINKRRSKALHLISMRQVRVSRGLERDVRVIRQELAKPDGIVTADPDEVEILQTSDMAAANLQMLQEAKAEIDMLGPNAALAGKNEQQMSGRAILAQQQGGVVEVAIFLDRIRSLSLEVYRHVWNRIRQYWTDERWIRVTDDERNMRFVGLNRPIRYVDQVAQQLGVTADNFAQFVQERPDDAAALQALARSPQGQAVVAMDNATAEMDVDIIVDEGIDTPTVHAEQFDTLVKALPAILTAQQQAPGLLEVLISASSLRDKDKLLEKLKGGNGQQGVDPQAAMQQQMQAAVMQQQAEAQVTLEKAKIDAAAKIEVAQINAQTDLVIAGAKADLDYQQAQLADQRTREQEAAKREADARAMGEAEAKAVTEPGPEGANLQALAKALEQLAAAQAAAAQPKRRVPIRDENGVILEMREEPLNG